MGKRLIEGYWDCKYCGTPKIRGGIRECPHCGKPRDENTTFYLSGTHRYVAPEVAATVNRNPDWICMYCNGLNSDSDANCTSCGAPRTAKNLNYFENKKKQSEKAEESSEVENETEEEKSSLLELSKILSFNTEILGYVLIGLFSLLAVIGIIYLFIPKDKEITITDMSWERTIEIQRYQTVEENDWELPPNGRLLYSRQEFSHYQQVLDHYETKTRQVAKEKIVGYEEYVVSIEDLGNGYFEETTDIRPVYETYYETETYEEPVYRDEPVYRTKYYYEIDKWLYERTERSSESNKTPYWPETTLATDERISSKNETYYVTGMDNKDREGRYTMTYEEWMSIKVNQTVTLQISAFGNATLVK
ncbi:MAG: hypothetical protein K2H53_02185 [Clostridia bacterium]|nr:hypothetical protein [Clostridia bacterium]